MVLPGLGESGRQIHSTVVLRCAHNSPSVLFDNTAESRYRGISVIIFVFMRLRAWWHETIFFLISNSVACFFFFDLTLFYFCLKGAMLQQSVSVTWMYDAALFLAAIFKFFCAFVCVFVWLLHQILAVRENAFPAWWGSPPPPTHLPICIYIDIYVYLYIYRYIYSI